MTFLELLNREQTLVSSGIQHQESRISDIVKKSTFLIFEPAGSIGQSITKENFKRNPRKLHAVDMSENNFVELVLNIRSSLGHIKRDFKTPVLAFD